MTLPGSVECLSLLRRVPEPKMEFAAVDEIHGTGKADGGDPVHPVPDPFRIFVRHPVRPRGRFKEKGRKGFSLRLKICLFLQPADDASPVFRIIPNRLVRLRRRSFDTAPR
jgi:hypothetical protein